METALRILVQKVGGAKPSPEDVKTVKKKALPEESDLDTERLACRVIARELERRQRKPRK
jgi:hypothetical protein